MHEWRRILTIPSISLPTLARRTCTSALVTLFMIFGLFSTAGIAQASGAPQLVTLPNSVASVAAAKLLGAHSSTAQMSVELVLQPNNATQLNALLAALYDPQSPQFHQWLPTGAFNARFAPSAAQVAQVTAFLQQAGLTVTRSSTPFLLLATGTTAQIEKAFHTQISNYQAADGQTFFQNSTAVQVPASLSGLILGVVGLSNTVRLHTHYLTTRQAAQQTGRAVPHYGAGPGGSGLTPSQITSLYNAKNVHQQWERGNGQGVTLAVFELSGYTPADITTYEQQFFGSSKQVPLVDINVDGGPITPKCPKGDQCNPPGDYSGDIEVEADIEMQIAVTPRVDRILVYNAPNDQQGITVLDEYFKIANDNLADAISSSWGICEQDAGYASAKAESLAFAQMATQGQSMFAAAGDTGAYDCLRDTGSPSLNALAVDDPASQPYVTAVGGTSFGSFDPGSNQHPSYPRGFETVWNPLNLCSATALNACGQFGAGGGGVSIFWPAPSYQQGPGVVSSYSQGLSYCSPSQTKGSIANWQQQQYCREVPDVSANADEFTPYAEYCTGNPKTNSTCASFSGGLTPPGWFGIGGTSLASPLWSGVIALWDSAHNQRFGNAADGLYELFNSSNAYSRSFHDITGVNQTENNNGYYPTTPYYDMTTGLGTPDIGGIVRFGFDH
jgi:subtilase family serine protease